ncbi:MAG: DUF362 domain-containing protein, partial [Acidobacteriota bacterium]
INIPVLKSHHSTYGATVAVKNYMGVVTRELNTNSHGAIRYGVLGAVMAEVQPPDLNIIDAIWINANPYDGPGTYYDEATRRDELVASVDPIAADRWAVKNILIPGFEDNGYTPPWPEPSADPDDPASDFREYLDNSMNYLLDAGYEVTNDPEKMDLFALAPPGEASDPEGAGGPLTIEKSGDGYQLGWSAPFTGDPVATYNLSRVDLGLGTSPAIPECEAALGSGQAAFLPALSDQSGFLVVGRNGAGDGSFGQNSRGFERPNAPLVAACP